MSADALIAGMGDYGPLAVMVGAVIVGLVLLFAVADAVGGPAKRKKKRVDTLTDRLRGGADAPQAATVQLRRDITYSRIKLVDQAIRQLMPRPDKLRTRLSRTGLKLSLAKYATLNIALFVATMLGLAVGLQFSPLISALVALSVGIGLPHYVVGLLIGRRQKKFLHLFPEAIDLMVRGLKSGLPISETIISVGREMKDPVGSEFRSVAEAVRLGETPEQAVWQAVERTGVYELNFFVTALSVQRETGGNLTETLENLSDVLRKRRQMKLKVKAMSSEARASAMIIGSLPFVMFGLLYMVNSGYVMKLFIDPRGVMMLVGGLVLMGFGIIVMAKMVRFDI
jgi:tight adherence protein B